MTRATKVQKLGFAKIVAINLNQLLRFLDFKTFSNSLLRKISFFSTFAILKRLWILICSQTFFCFKSASINFAAILNLNFVLASEAQNFILSLNSAQKNFATSLSRKSCFCKIEILRLGRFRRRRKSVGASNRTWVNPMHFSKPTFSH